MNQKSLLSITAVFSLVAFSGSNIAMAYHFNDWPLQAQAVDAVKPANASATFVKRKTVKSPVAKQIQQLMDQYYKAQPLVDHGDGDPDEGELEDALKFVTAIRDEIQQLKPVTKKDQKAYNKMLGELNREIKNFGEQLFRQTAMENLRDEENRINQMDVDWGDPGSLQTQIGAFQELVAQWEALKPEAAKYSKGIVREVNEVTRYLKERVSQMQDDLARRDQPPPASDTTTAVTSESKPSAAVGIFVQLDAVPGFDGILRSLYDASPPGPCVGVTFDKCGDVMKQAAVSGGDLTPFAQLILRAANQVKVSTTLEEIIRDIRAMIAAGTASMYHALLQAKIEGMGVPQWRRKQQRQAAPARRRQHPAQGRGF